MNIKKILVSTATSAIILTSAAFPAFAAGSQQIPWNLSGAVMPVPPYGSLDIPGSDTASKLIYNQPNGKVKGMVTGAMNGLHPNTVYTVYLSNSYTPYSTTINVGGITGFDFEYLGAHYIHSANLTQTDSSVTGNGGYPAGGSYTYAWTIDNGSVVGNHLHLEMHYTAGATCNMTMDGDITTSGSIANGTWSDDCSGPRNGTWTSIGSAVLGSGTTTWPGQLAGTTPFTFVTDDTGSGSWHYNFTGSVPAFSVWINDGGTMLISNPISPTS